ncbi:MAG: aldehyde dehydrogenase family protein [Pseudomonadota bacterium]
MAVFFGDAPIGSWINGKMVPGTGAEFDLIDPATAKPFLTLRDAGAELVDAAMTAAAAAQKIWWGKTPSDRGRILWQIGQQVRAAQEDLALLETVGAGKPIRDTRVEVLKVAEMFEYYAGWADKLHGDVIPVPTSHLNYTRPEPYGVVTQITPWNAPIFTAGWQVAPALCAGNAAVLKPSEMTPLTSLALAVLAQKAGLPDGVMTVLTGLGTTTGQAATTHDITRKVVFVGSPRTGAMIAAQAARNVVPCVLELGGKSANIVFDDADLKRAALGAQAAIFSGAGQSCVAGSRLLVQRSVLDRFVDLVVAGADHIPVGDPLNAATQIGPINNAAQYQTVQNMIAAGQAEGAQLLAGGMRPDDAACQDGYFLRPTVLGQVRNDMQIAREEIFGPVVSVIAFDDEDEAIAIANDNKFGLAGAVWTGAVDRAHRVASRVRAGTFWINSYKTISVMSPFGGFGASGYGRSSGREGLMEYMQPKSIWTETAANPPVGFGYAPDV